MRFIETIRMVDGNICLLPLHIERIAQTLSNTIHDLSPVCTAAKALYPKGIIKCRIEYDQGGICSQTFAPYTPRHIHTLSLVRIPKGFDYHLKYADRTIFRQLKEQHPESDELLLIRNGLLTDTTYTNVVVCRRGKYYTPRQPLLQGVMRSYLLRQHKIISTDIPAADLHLFDTIHLINAMLPLGNIALSTNSIH